MAGQERSSLWVVVFFSAVGFLSTPALLDLPIWAGLSEPPSLGEDFPAEAETPQQENPPTTTASFLPPTDIGDVRPAEAPLPPAKPLINEETPVRTRSELADKINSILRKSRHTRAFWGIEVYSLEDDEILYSYNNNKDFSPASNVKVFTTAAALDRLGPGFRFKTRISYEGALAEDGILRGNLVISGGGDPNLADNLYDNPNPFVYLDLMAQRIYEAGIRVIEGDVIGDDSYFPYSPYGNGWKMTDLTTIYGAPVSALSFYNNLITLIARPAHQLGQPVRVSFDPTSSFMRVINRSTTVRAGRRSSFRSSSPPGKNHVVLSGSMPASSRGWVDYVPVDDPALYTATVLRDRLKRLGVSVTGAVRSRHYGENQIPGASQEIYVHESASLIDVIAYINKKSQNLYAEILLRTLGAELKGIGADSAGLQVVSEFLREAGIPRGMVDLQDGSGLSRFNLITPRAETLLLAYVSTKPYFPLFLESLPISGLDGTLKNRMAGTATRERIYAKTGTLYQVTTLGGYIKTRSNKTLAFSILINNHQFSPFTARHAMDEICAVLAKH